MVQHYAARLLGSSKLELDSYALGCTKPGPITLPFC